MDADEVKSIQEYDSLMQEKTDYVKAKTVVLEQAKKDRANTIEDIQTANQELSNVAATLLDDQQYLAELTQMCQDKAKTWDQRTQVRADELSALHAAIQIIKTSVSEKTTAATVRLAQEGISVRSVEAVASDEDVMSALEAGVEDAEAAPAFLQLTQKAFLAQVKPTEGDVRQKVMDMLRAEGQHLKSAVLTALATEISADPFAKVKVLIQELIERLLKEANNEANQKGWCDKATKDAEQKRDFAAEAIAELNANMAQLEARIDKLTSELVHLTREILQLKNERQQATEDREAEKAENEATVTEAKVGLAAVSEAIDILFKFYATSKKGTVELQKGPAEDAPDAGFENFEAYKGKQGEAEGIMGMLEVIKSDFERTVTETEKAEAAAQKDYMEYMTESGKSLAQKEESQTELTRQKDDAESKFNEAQEDLNSQTEILQGALQELLELKPACVDTGMSYADRVANREDEIQALHKALCILEAYEKYGPDGLGDAC